MISLRSAFYLFGNLLAVLGSLMIIPMMTDLSNGEDSWVYFLNSLATTIFVSGFLISATKSVSQKTYKVKELILAIFMFWFIGSIFAALPFIHSSLPYEFSDCYFEIVSSLTATGSTVIYDFNSMPRSFIIWRSILQLVGASLFVTSSYYVMRTVYGIAHNGNGSTVVYQHKYDILSTLNHAKPIVVFYVSATVIGTMILSAINGSSFVENFYLASSLFTASGIPYKDLLIIYDYRIICLVMLFIFISGLPVNSVISVLKGDIQSVRDNTQIKIYCLLIGASFLLVTFMHRLEITQLKNVVDSMLCILSSATTNNLHIEVDYQTKIVTYLLNFIGGCAGSATGGVKVFRIWIAFVVLKRSILEIAHTDSIFVVRNKDIVFENGIIRRTLAYFTIVIASIALFAFLLSTTGIPFNDAISYAYTSLMNSSISTVNNSLSAADIFSMAPLAKFLLSAAMICGRLEFITICAIFTINFWNK